jgi:hypothetical protein
MAETAASVVAVEEEGVGAGLLTEKGVSSVRRGFGRCDAERLRLSFFNFVVKRAPLL